LRGVHLCKHGEQGVLAEVIDVGGKKRTIFKNGVYIKRIDLCTFVIGYARNTAASAQ